MKILMVHPHDLFDRSEPWTIRIKNIAREYVKKGHEVKICYFPLIVNEKHMAGHWESIEVIPMDRMPSPGAFIMNTKKLIKLSKWSDVVHFQKCHHYASVPTAIAAYVTGRKLHYEWDDWEEKIWYESCGRGTHSRFIGLSFNVLERWLPVLSDSVSCASQHLKDLTHKFGVKKERIFDAPVGADLERFRPDLDGRWVRDKYGIKGDLVLYIGQLHGAQYVNLLIKAANIVLHYKPEATFMIVGEGFLEHTLKDMVRDLGIERRVIFTGSIPHDDIPYYVSTSDVCVAAFNETEVTICKSPLKIVEYLASGKAIVASNVGEVRKMVGGVGMLVEPSDHHALSEGIIKLLDDKGLREILRHRARRRAEEKYNWTWTAENVMKAYNLK
ncbi:MAG: glycosyltransferase family 4 protein [Candidatus Omnitrophica bacterium]|nr:glycosyltransferase family 4 protein [Candidatus Omnitrophota bacterium]